MNDYYLRCIESDFAELAYMAELLGVVKTVDGQLHATGGGIWDYIGYKYAGPIPAEGEEDTRTVVADQDGVPYIHINVRTPINVREVATAMATENPAIAQALSQIPRFFITDAEGNATTPEFPLRVFL